MAFLTNLFFHNHISYLTESLKTAEQDF